MNSSAPWVFLVVIAVAWLCFGWRYTVMARHYPRVPFPRIELEKTADKHMEDFLMGNKDQYDELIESCAATFDISAKLLKAVIQVESNFDFKAYRHEPWVKHLDGPDSSFGLTQILYSTAKGLGFDGNPIDLHHPATNIYYGAMYLSKQLFRYDGDVQKAIAAYNAGSAKLRAGYASAFRNQGYVDKVNEAMGEGE